MLKEVEEEEDRGTRLRLADPPVDDVTYMCTFLPDPARKYS